MDLAIRQLIYQAVQEAVSESAYVKLHCADGNTLKVRADLVCFETHVEATNEFGIPVTLPYSQIESAVAVRPRTRKAHHTNAETNRPT
jgi:hypothetical protein